MSSYFPFLLSIIIFFLFIHFFDEIVNYLYFSEKKNLKIAKE